MANARTAPETSVGRARAPRGVGPSWARIGGRRSWPAPVRAFLVVALGFYLLYLFVANLVLATNVVRDAVNGSPDEMMIGYRSAYSLVPGWVTVSDFTLRFQDRNVQFLLALDRASFRLDLPALTKKQFHVTRLRGEGAQARFRMKVDAAESGRARVGAFPPIYGYADPPIRVPRPDAGTVKPTPPASHYWTIYVEDISASVRELWFAEVRWVGGGAVRGSFRLEPMRELDVWPSELDLADGDLAVEDAPIIHLRASQLFATVHHFDVRVPRGVEVLRFIDARARLRGTVASITPLAELYAGKDGPHVSGDVGEVDIDAAMEGGVLLPGASAHLRLADVAVRGKQAAVRGPLDVRAVVEAPADAPRRIALDAHSTAAFLDTGEVASHDRHAARIGDAFARARLAFADLAKPPPTGEALLDAGVELREVVVPDLAALRPLAPKDVVPRSGELSLAARATLEKRALTARADAVLGGARARFGTIEVGATGPLSVDLATEDATKAIAGSATAHLTDVSIVAPDARVSGLAVDVRAKDAIVGLATGSVTSMVAVHATPGSRVLEAVSAMAGAPRWLARAAAGPDASASLRVHKGSRMVELRVLDARDGVVHARGVLRQGDDHGKRGAFLIEAEPLRAGIALPPGGGGADVVPFADQGWLDSRLRALP